jgi:glucosamine 6-phosphate synthetase-like amidotransferase/phosphosugar isomerase protein
MPVIVFAGRDKLFNKTVSNIQEIIARDAQVVLISDKKGIESAKLQTWKTVEMPEVDEIVAPKSFCIFYIISLNIPDNHQSELRFVYYSTVTDFAKCLG